MRKLTEKDKEIVGIIKQYHLEHGYMPSYREIANKAGMSSSASVEQHMTRLFDLGILETDFDDFIPPRGYRIARNYEY